MFTRIAMKNDVGQRRFSSSFASGDYQFIFDRKVLGRTDWYAYDDDEFGTTLASTFADRKSVSDHLDHLGLRYYSANEVMFRKSLSLADMTEIRCENSWLKDDLVDALHNVGIYEINGTKIEQFIKVGKGKL